MIRKGIMLKFWSICLLIVMGTLTSACDSDSKGSGTEDSARTLFMFFPWSNNLYSYILQNIADMKTAIAANGLKSERVVVLRATSSTEAQLYEITLVNGACVDVPLVEYSDVNFTTQEQLKMLFEDVMREAPAKSYAMAVGCHGMGWIPVSRTESASLFRMRQVAESEYWDYEESQLTRYFGGTSADNQIDITDLAAALKAEGLYMNYILFDDCYMASMEVAYDLREVTHYLMGSTCEMMAYGLPYQKIGGYLLGEPNYSKVCSEFYNFYSTYSTPCGTLSVTDCTQADAMASIMKRINAHDTFDETQLDDLQTLDGYTPTRFFDFGDYVAHLCTDNTLLAEFNTELSKLVPYSVHTPTYYTQIKDRQITLKAFSGLTISDPSISSMTRKKSETGWYKATH